MSAITTTTVHRIQQLAADLDQLGKTALEKAAEAGHLLAECKDNLQHGQWLPWLEENFTFTDRTARRWMKLAEDLDAGRLKSDTVSNLAEAYRLTTTTRPIAEPLCREERERLAELESRINQALASLPNDEERELCMARALEYCYQNSSETNGQRTCDSSPPFAMPAPNQRLIMVAPSGEYAAIEPMDETYVQVTWMEKAKDPGHGETFGSVAGTRRGIRGDRAWGFLTKYGPGGDQWNRAVHAYASWTPPTGTTANQNIVGDSIDWCFDCIELQCGNHGTT